MQKSHRQGRLSEEIRRIVSELMRRELKDPRISSMASISGVEATEDGSYATIYLSVMGSEEEKNNTLAAFKSASGFIRKEIGRKVKIRHVPELNFKIDTSLDYGLHISKIIDDLDKEK